MRRVLWTPAGSSPAPADVFYYTAILVGDGEMNPVDQFRELMDSGLLASPNKERLARVFYDAAKIVLERQEQSGKKQLKMKQVSSALVLAETLYSQAFHFDAVGELGENFGGPFSEDKALEYFEKKVMGDVFDIHGRKIVIDEQSMNSLYKEAGTGKHIVATENYEQARGKRLPWIRNALQKSAAIYVSEEKVSGSFRRTFLYTGIASIPLGQEAETEYYVVPVREGKNDLRMTTAYSMTKRSRFVKMLALTIPYVHVV